MTTKKSDIDTSSNPNTSPLLSTNGRRQLMRMIQMHRNFDALIVLNEFLASKPQQTIIPEDDDFLNYDWDDESSADTYFLDMLKRLSNYDEFNQFIATMTAINEHVTTTMATAQNTALVQLTNALQHAAPAMQKHSGPMTAVIKKVFTPQAFNTVGKMATAPQQPTVQQMYANTHAAFHDLISEAHTRLSQHRATSNHTEATRAAAELHMHQTAGSEYHQRQLHTERARQRPAAPTPVSREEERISDADIRDLINSAIYRAQTELFMRTVLNLAQDCGLTPNAQGARVINITVGGRQQFSFGSTPSSTTFRPPMGGMGGRRIRDEEANTANAWNIRPDPIRTR
jgi:hypothetical protein